MASKLIVASNRGPVSWGTAPDGSRLAKRGAGGLIVALAGALQQRPGVWVSVALDEGDQEMAAANPGRSFTADTAQGSFQLRLVDVGEQYDRYYNQVANRMLWFTLHQLWSEPYEPSGIGWSDAYEDYVEVNHRVARAVIDEAREVSRDGEGTEIHLQDYHLLVAAPFIREALPKAHILLYVHTPWVHPTYFRRLPDAMVRGILGGLSACDLVGISAPEWAQNLRDCLTDLGEGIADFDRIRTASGSTLIRDFVLGIDRVGLNGVARSEATAEARKRIADEVGDRKLIVRADRTDLSKNILRGLHAFDLMLERAPELADEVHFRMLLNPSRQKVPEYRRYLEKVVEESDRLNQRWGDDVVRAVVDDDFPHVVAALQTYDVLLVNAVIDGTNLVAKEGPALNNNDGVLVLSRNTGAATVMGAALSINPFDVDQQATALQTALDMTPAERSRRALSLKASAAMGSPADWIASQRSALREAVRH